MRSALTHPIEAPVKGRSPDPDDAARSTEGLDGRRLATKLRLRDGRIYEGAVTPERHRRLHLGLLHADSDGYVELAAGPRIAGRLRVRTRKDPGHFLPGGATATPSWLVALLALADQHATAGDEVFVAPAVRAGRGASKTHVHHTRWLWIDVDGRDGLPVVRQLVRRKPAHLVIESGSGGVHCYWRLRTPLLARANGDNAIERAHERLIYALGYEWRDGTPVPTVADRACKDRSRVMRLAGTINGKTANHARIIWADLALAKWTVTDLVGDLPASPKPVRAYRHAARHVNHEDPYKRIAPVDYFQRLARIEVPEHRLVSCPNPAHGDTTPSCHVGADASEGWCCFGCGAAGAIYDLASVVLGGPTGRWLRGDAFGLARDHVARTFGAI